MKAFRGKEFLLVVVVLLFDAFGLLGLHTSFWGLCLSGSGLCTLETQKPGQTHQGRSPEDVDRNDYRMLGQCRKATNPDQCNRCHRDGGHDQGQGLRCIFHDVLISFQFFTYPFGFLLVHFYYTILC